MTAAIQAPQLLSSRRANPWLAPGWRIVRLAEVAEHCLGKMLDAKKNKGRPFPYLRNPNVQWFNIDTSDLKEMPFEDDELERYGLRKGDVLVCEGGEAGRAAIWDGARTDVKFQKAVHRVRPGKDLLNRYLVYRLMTDYYSGRLADYYTGTTIKHLTGQDLAQYEFPLPPLEEQQQIAEILDKAEALRAKRRAALAKLDTLTQSIFLDLFGDVAKNDRNWPAEPLGDLMRVRRGGSPRPIEKYLGGDINWIKIGDATKGSDIYLESCADKITRDGLKKTVFLRAGSLIFANCGVSLGFARVLKIDGCIHDGWLSFEDIPEDKLDKLFLLKALNSITENFRAIAPAGTQPNLNTGLMKSFRMIIPPLSLQQEFASRLSSAEQLKACHRASLAKFDALFASLQHRAFRGEL